VRSCGYLVPVRGATIAEKVASSKS
jgi:hypothetical protein